MNVLNRIIMVLIVLFLIVVVGTVLLTPLNFVDQTRLNLDYAQDVLSDVRVLLIFRIICGGLLLVLLILLWFELWRPRRKSVRIKTESGGRAQLDVQSVAQSLEYRIDELPGVRQVRPRIISRGKDVEVILDLDTSPSVNIPALTDQIVKLSNDIVEGQLGIKIRSRVRLNIRHEPYPRGKMPPTAPAARESAAASESEGPAAKTTEPVPASEAIPTLPETASIGEEPKQAPEANRTGGSQP